MITQLLCEGLLLSTLDGCLQQVGQGCLAACDGLLHLLSVVPVHLQLYKDGVPALPRGIWDLGHIWKLGDDVLRQGILQKQRLVVSSADEAAECTPTSC
jgi:hypothetical protein